MRIAYQPVGGVLGDTLALMTLREPADLSLHNTNTDILAIVKGRFKPPLHINRLMSYCGIPGSRWGSPGSSSHLTHSGCLPSIPSIRYHAAECRGPTKRPSRSPISLQ
jgi:hypothetical protein